MNPQNGLRIAPFKNAAQLRATDKELLHLKDYLLSITHLPSFTDLNHKNCNKKKANYNKTKHVFSMKQNLSNFQNFVLFQIHPF